jgi:tripartite-type tricarboxylate transporter receptor subunit TctC
MKERICALVIPFALIVGLISFSPIPTLAAFPEKPVTLIVGFPPGGTTDFTSRTIAEAAKKYFPKPIAVVNRPGAGGGLGMAEVLQAKPDGYTIGLLASDTMTMVPHWSKVPYGSADEYTPIINLVSTPVVIAVKSDAPWKTIQELITYAKANPGKVRAAGSGMGNAHHLACEQLKAAGIDLHWVPFAGAAETTPALLGGHVESVISYYSNIAGQVQAKKIRILAVWGEKRHPLFPEAPTFREVGYDVVMMTYFTIGGPKGLPAEILSSLHDALKKSMETPLFIKAMESRGFVVTYEGPQDLKNHVLRDYESIGKLSQTLKKDKK